MNTLSNNDARNAILQALSEVSEIDYKGLVERIQLDDNLVWEVTNDLNAEGYVNLIDVSSKDGKDFIASLSLKGKLWVTQRYHGGQ